MHLAGSNMILKEAPRLYSPQIRLNRRTCKTVKLGGITYPKGMSVIMAISSFTMIQNSWATMPKNSIQRGLQVGCRRHQRIRSPTFLFSWGSRVCMGAELLDEPEHDSATCSPAPCPLISLRPHGAQIHYDIPGISPSCGISSWPRETLCLHDCCYLELEGFIIRVSCSYWSFGFLLCVNSEMKQGSYVDQ